MSDLTLESTFRMEQQSSCLFNQHAKATSIESRPESSAALVTIKFLNITMTQWLVSWDTVSWVLIGPHLAHRGMDLEVLSLLAPAYYLVSLLAPLYLSLKSRVRPCSRERRALWLDSDDTDSSSVRQIARDVSGFGSPAIVAVVSLFAVIGAAMPMLSDHWSVIVGSRAVAGVALAVWETSQPPGRWSLSNSDLGVPRFIRTLDALAVAKYRVLRIPPLFDDFGWMHGLMMASSCLVCGAILHAATWKTCLLLTISWSGFLLLANLTVLVPSAWQWLVDNFLGAASCIHSGSVDGTPLCTCTACKRAEKSADKTAPWHGQFGLRELDYLGAGIIFAAVILLWAGVFLGSGAHYSWTSPIVLTLLVSSSLLLIAFGFVERYFACRPIIVHRWLHIRNVTLSFVCLLLVGTAHATHLFYLPLYFVYVKGDRQMHLALRLFAYLLGWVPAGLAVDWATPRYDTYRLFVWVGTGMLCAGAALLTQLTAYSHTDAQIGYLIINGIGMCLAIRGLLFTVNSARFVHDNMPAALHLMRYLTRLGHIIGVGVINCVVISHGHSLWKQYGHNDGWNMSDITIIATMDIKESHGGVTFGNIYDAKEFMFFNEVFCRAFSVAFYMLIPAAGISFALSLFIRHLPRPI
ncbi:hypothetical protein FBU59_002580 [Linderina macrospora]|uniref:Uncharacterized protein n=1 Tax=Linderina macrospora TaxID=4868 RepID=A0ACC1JAS8_9FUNG|nr:hypothetical protein FBU59_002580 [Linderina macrospora]